MAKKAGKIANLEKALADDPLPADRARHRPHPLGHPRRPDRRQRPPARVRRTGGSRVVHNGIIENFAALRAELAAAGHHAASPRPTPRSSPTCSASRSRAGAGSDRGACGRSAAGCTAPSPWSRSTPQRPDRWWRPAGTRRWWSGSATGENFLASDVAAFIEHTREAIELGQDQVVDDHRRRRSRSPTSTATPAEVRPYHVDWDLSAAEKGGFDWFMRKEIYEQPKAVADTLLGRHDAAGALTAGRDPDLRGRAARGRQDRRHRLRHRLLRRAGREVRDRALDPDPVRGRAGQRVPLPRPDRRTDDPGRRDQPVGRDGRHADGHPARPGAEGPGAGDLQHQRRRPSRASPTR